MNISNGPLSHEMPEDVIKAGEIKVKGDATEAARLFDRYRPEKAVVIPQAFLEHAY